MSYNSLYLAAAGLLTLFLSRILIPIIRKIAISGDLVDVPNNEPDKIHGQPIPHLGGVAIFISLVGGFIFLLLVVKVDLRKSLGVLAGGFLAFALGLWDDLGWKRKVETYKPNVKFLIQVLVSASIACILWFSGHQFRFIPVSIIGIIASAFYVFGGMNAINMQDGLDGIAGGVTILSGAGFAVISFLLSNELGFAISILLISSVLGFLFFNLPPASIFMGDGGSHFLGTLLASLAILLTSEPYDFSLFFGVILIIGLPVFDAANTVIRRAIRGDELFSGDRGHYYDKLRQKGISLKKTLAISYFSQALVVSLGVFIAYYL